MTEHNDQNFSSFEVEYFNRIKNGEESYKALSPSLKERYDFWMKSNDFVSTTVNRESNGAKRSYGERNGLGVFNEYNANKCKIPITDLTEEEMKQFFVGFYPVKESKPDENGHIDKIQDSKTWLKFRPDFTPTEEHDYIGWSQRNYLLTWEEAKTCDGFNGVVREGIVVVDFDKHDIEKEPVYTIDPMADGKMFARLVHTNHLNCMIVKTNNGIHGYFKNSAMNIGSPAGMYNACNMRCDFRANGSASICLKINGQPRVVVYKPNKTATMPIKVDELPVYLEPASKHRLLDEKYLFPIHLDNLKEREITFRNYILKLINMGYKDKQIEQIILAINRCLTSPLAERELFDKLLNPSKLKGARKAAKLTPNKKPEEYLKNGQEEFVASQSQGVCEKEICRAIRKFNVMHKNEKFVGIKKNRGIYEIIINKDGTFHEVQLTAPALSALVTTQEFYWTNLKIDDNTGEHVFCPPQQIVFKGIVDSDGFNSDLPVYTRITTGAMITKEGRIIKTRGLDEETGVYLLHDIEVPEVPENPTWEDVEDSKKLFSNVFKDFQFEISDDCPEDKIDCNVNYQNLIFALFLAVFRPVIKNAFPIIVIDKSSERSGASLMSSVLSRMAFGKEAESISLSQDNVQEGEKQINSLILESSIMNIVDNVTYKTKLNFPSLLSATSGDGTFKVRVLGKSQYVECEKNSLWVLNGIKVPISADMCARIIKITLALPNSWQKMTFSRTKNELLQMAIDLHPECIHAVGVMLNYWISQGKPLMPKLGVNLSEYLDVYNFIGSILYCCGYHKILSNAIDVVTDSNEKESNGVRFINAFYEKFGEDEVTIDNIISMCMKERMERNQTAYGDNIGTRQNYRYGNDLLTMLFNSREVKELEGIDYGVVGRRLSKYIDIVFDGAEYVLRRRRNRVSNRYRLVKVTAEDSKKGGKK